MFPAPELCKTHTYQAGACYSLDSYFHFGVLGLSSSSLSPSMLSLMPCSRVHIFLPDISRNALASSCKKQSDPQTSGDYRVYE